MQEWGLIITAYFIGAIPFGLLLSRWIKGVDPRQTGSGNIGATNTLRASGKLVGILTLCADITKGAIPVAIAIRMGDEQLVTLVAMAAFVGHIFPVYLRFKGGKGVATMLGVLLPWHISMAVGAFFLWCITLAACRYVSVASMLAGFCLPILAWYMDTSASFLLFCTIISIVIIIRHSHNLYRLLKGTESKIGSRG